MSGEIFLEIWVIQIKEVIYDQEIDILSLYIFSVYDYNLCTST